MQALHTLVSQDGKAPAIAGFADKACPLSMAEKAMIAEAAKRMDEATGKRSLGVKTWAHDVSWVEYSLIESSRPKLQGIEAGTKRALHSPQCGLEPF